MESLGSKLQHARLARGLTLDEAGRLTKIRPAKLAEIEAEDFSSFPSLTYARGFLQIYGKFLDVDVTPYLEAFETSDAVTVDGYQYLQEAPEPPPQSRRPVAPVRRPREPREGVSIWPFVIGVVVLVAGFWILKTIMDVQRVKTHATASATPTAAATPANISAPRAQPVDNTTASANTPAATPATTPVTAAQPVATPQQTAVAAASEPEVRRAEPVRAQDDASSTAAAKVLNKIDIKPLKKTYIKVVVDGKSDSPAVERWITPSDKLLRVTGSRVNIRVLDRTAVDIRKNGKAVGDDDADVSVE